MDELKKKRAEKLKKAVDIVDGVADNFDKAFKQRELNALYERKFLLEDKIKDTSKCPVTIVNAKLQLKSVEDSIALLEEQVSLQDEYDIDVDEAAARQFIAENPDVFGEGTLEMIESNDALDELERTLGLSSEKDKK